MRVPSTIRSYMVAVFLAAWACSSQAQIAGPIAEKGPVPPNAASGAPDLSATETIRARVDEVNLVFTVTKAGGRFVSKLSLNDLDVLDNQRAPERINYFRQQADMPLRVALLVDLSDSIVSRFQYEKRAAAAFLKKVLRPEIDQAFLVGFASEVKLVQDSSSDIDKLAGGLRRMKVGGNTKLYDAIEFASAKLRRESDAGATRRAIVIISDGVDTYSRALMHDATQSALHAETMLYALSTNDVQQDGYGKGEAVLDLLTRPTGGVVLPANTEGRMTRAFSTLKEALHSQYVIAYKPAQFERDGRFRSIKVVPRNPHLVVNCRRGYFAPREDHDSASHALGP